MQGQLGVGHWRSLVYIAGHRGSLMDIGGHQGSPGSHWGHWWTLVDKVGHQGITHHGVIGSLQGSTMVHLGSLGDFWGSLSW